MNRFISLKKLFPLILGSVLIAGSVPEVSCQEVYELGQKVRLVDVRTSEEYHGSGGHIAGAELQTLGPQLTAFLKTIDPQERIIFICRSGSRSAKAVTESLQLGFGATASMAGGMLKWTELGYPTQK